MVSTLRIRSVVGAVLLAALGQISYAQQAALSLGSGSGSAGTSVGVGLTLASSGGASPTALQWRLTYPMNAIASVTFTAGPAATAAGKTLTCAPNAGWIDCALHGMNTTAIANGVVATASVSLLSTITASAPLGVSNARAANASGNAVDASSTGGTISLLNPPPPPPSGSTWVISGRVLGGGGSSINLSGAASRTVVADANGYFGFGNLANGTYTVTPSKAGLTMTPGSRAVTINGASMNNVNFTAAATTPSTWTISGNLTQGANALVTLGGAANRTTNADGSGNYSFTGLADGNYTVVPAKSGVTFTPTVRAVAVSGANQAGINFAGSLTDTTAPPSIDRTVWTDSRYTGPYMTSPTFSTSQGNELLLAFISTDSVSGGETVRSVTGAGLQWALVRRTNTQGGTAEIWRAFASQALTGVNVAAALSARVTGSMTVMSFAGVDTTSNGLGAIGAAGGGSSPSGTPSASLITSRGKSLVIGVANDPSLAAQRTVASGQMMVHELVLQGQGSFWVQRFNNPVASAGSNVTVSSTAPGGSRFNMSVVEVRGPAPATSSDFLSNIGPASGRMATRAEGGQESDGRSARRSAAVVLTNTVTGEPGDACSPSGWASVTGASFTAGESKAAQTVPLPFELAGVRVEMNGQPVPLLLASPAQVNFQCPNLPPGTALNMKVETAEGEMLEAAPSKMSPAAPALFTVDGSQRAVVQIASTSQLALPVTVAPSEDSVRPARPGEHIRVYASGLGATTEILAPGMPAPLDRAIAAKNEVVAVAGGIEVKPLFAGLAPGTVGVFQVDLVLPESVAPGSEVPLFLRVELPDGSVRLSQQTVLAVAAPSTQAAER